VKRLCRFRSKRIDFGMRARRRRRPHGQRREQVCDLESLGISVIGRLLRSGVSLRRDSMLVVSLELFVPVKSETQLEGAIESVVTLTQQQPRQDEHLFDGPFRQKM